MKYLFVSAKMESLFSTNIFLLMTFSLVRLFNRKWEILIQFFPLHVFLNWISADSVTFPQPKFVKTIHLWKLLKHKMVNKIRFCRNRLFLAQGRTLQASWSETPAQKLHARSWLFWKISSRSIYSFKTYLTF